jgi:hypothetical protein
LEKKNRRKKKQQKKIFSKHLDVPCSITWLKNKSHKLLIKHS